MYTHCSHTYTQLVHTCVQPFVCVVGTRVHDPRVVLTITVVGV